MHVLREVAVAAIGALAAVVLVGCDLGREVARGDPTPVAGLRCEGVPATVCLHIHDTARRETPDGTGRLRGIHIRCDASQCTEAFGDAVVTITYADGRTVSRNEGWQEATAAPVASGEPSVSQPPPPVEPVCIGVDREHCLEMGNTASLAPPGTDVPVPVAILVRCTSTCDARRGGGETVARYADGTSKVVRWDYGSGQ